MAPFVLLVLEVEQDFHEIIQKCQQLTNHSRPIQIYQTTWKDIEVGPCNNFTEPLFKSRCPVLVKATWKKEVPTQLSPATRIYPDLVVIRNEVVTAHQNYRNKLLGFVYSEVPCMNSSRSILLNLDRAAMMAALTSASRRCVREHGAQARIPIVSQELFTNWDTCYYSRTYPMVMKMGSFHAAMGKAKVNDRNSFDDLRSILPLTKNEYGFGEPFLKGSHDLRLQKIGTSNYRVFERRSVRSNDWKTNDSWCEVEEVPKEKIQLRHKQWLDAAQVMFGEDDETGKMDIVTIDILVTKDDDKEHVLEVNGTSSGFLDFDDQLELGKLILEKVENVGEKMKKLNEEHQDMMMKCEEEQDDGGDAQKQKKDDEETQKRKSAINSELVLALQKRS